MKEINTLRKQQDDLIYPTVNQDVGVSISRLVSVHGVPLESARKMVLGPKMPKNPLPIYKSEEY